MRDDALCKSISQKDNIMQQNSSANTKNGFSGIHPKISCRRNDSISKKMKELQSNIFDSGTTPTKFKKNPISVENS